MVEGPRAMLRAQVTLSTQRVLQCGLGVVREGRS